MEAYKNYWKPLLKYVLNVIIIIHDILLLYYLWGWVIHLFLSCFINTALLKSGTNKKRLLEPTLIVSFYYGGRKFGGIAVFFVLMSVLTYIVVHLSLFLMLSI